MGKSIFTFNISKGRSKPKPNYKRINKNDCFVILDNKIMAHIAIDINGDYYAVVNKERIPLTKDSLSCKGKKVVYKTAIERNSCNKIIRSEEVLSEMNSFMYKPFRVGSDVIGDIVTIYGEKKFHIKDVLTTGTNEHKEDVDFYINNYETIRNNQLKLYEENFNV